MQNLGNAAHPDAADADKVENPDIQTHCFHNFIPLCYLD
jgi:hypothetical protein